MILQLLGLAAWTSGRRLSADKPALVLQSRQFPVPLVDELGTVISHYVASASFFAEDLGGIALEMALIPGGTFQMGSVSNVDVPPLIISEQPIHQVSLKPFALGVFPVTVGQWRQVSSFPRISHSLHAVPAALDGNLPMDVVFGDEIDEFCRRLQTYTGRAYRRPSEAEWEYACRAGTTTRYHFGDGISLQVANYNDGVTRPVALTIVGSKRAPNRFGLHDMHGNVLEQCSDWVHARYDGAPQDGSAWTSGDDASGRVARGGCYLFGANAARSAARYPEDLREAFGGGGFRLALDVSSDLLDPSILEVANAASGLVGSLSPGEIVRVRGSNIGPPTPISTGADQNGVVESQLSGIRVLFDGIPAPLLYVSSEQVNTVVPYGVQEGTSPQVMVESQGQSSAPMSVLVTPSSPGVFTLDSSGHGQAAALNEDGSLNSSNNPAARGSVVSIFATGEGRTNPPGVDGKLAGSPLPAPVLQVQLFIGDSPTYIEYAGGAPGEISGVPTNQRASTAYITAWAANGGASNRGGDQPK
jgi:uncharacterized protein (TIGR03437 family)